MSEYEYVIYCYLAHRLMWQPADYICPNTQTFMSPLRSEFSIWRRKHWFSLYLEAYVKRWLKFCQCIWIFEFIEANTLLVPHHHAWHEPYQTKVLIWLLIFFIVWNWWYVQDSTFQKMQIKLLGGEICLVLISGLWKVKQSYFLKMRHKTEEE